MMTVCGLDTYADQGSSSQFHISAAFGNDMVLQQNQPLDLFGFGESGTALRIQLKKDNTVIEEAQTTVTAEGKWKVSLNKRAGSYDTYEILITDGIDTQRILNVLIGEVWIAGGQSNMQMKVKETVEANTYKNKERNSYIRFFLPSDESTVPLSEPLSEPKGNWRSGADWYYTMECSAIAYYFAEKLQPELDVPVGVVCTARGSTTIRTWVDRGTVDNSPEFKKYLQEYEQYDESGSWFNARIAPLSGLHATGILWYQGETDLDTQQHDALRLGLPLVDKSWSAVFGNGDGSLLPLISVQLAPYTFYPTELDLPLGNEMMQKGVEAINAAGGKAISIPIYDLPLDYGTGPWVHPVHPWTKEPIGIRCYDAALGLVYGKQGIFSGPVIQSAVYKDNQVRLTFTNTGLGLTSRDGEPLKGFVAVSKSGVSTPVSATIEGNNTVILSVGSDSVPESINYAFATMNTDANLYNLDGYLSLPFRIAVTNDEQTNNPPNDNSDTSSGSASSDVASNGDSNSSSESSGNNGENSETLNKSNEGLLGIVKTGYANTVLAIVITVAILSGAASVVIIVLRRKEMRKLP